MGRMFSERRLKPVLRTVVAAVTVALGLLGAVVLLHPGPAHEFRAAAARGDIARAEQILAEHPSVLDSRGRRGETALWLAARGGHTSLVKVLMEKGADPGVDGGSLLPLPPIAAAACMGHTETVRAMLEARVAPANPDRLLIVAAQCGHPDVVRLLLDRGSYTHDTLSRALFDAAGSDGEATIRYFAMWESRMPTEAEMRLGPPGGDRDAAGACQVLMDHGADPDYVAVEGCVGERSLACPFTYTALHAVARRGQSGLTSLLLANGANPNLISSSCTTALDEAVDQGYGNVATLIRDAGGLEAEDVAPVLVACYRGDGDSAARAIAAGQSVTQATCGGSTALHYALPWGLREVARLLISAGADPNATDAEGRGPLHLAVKSGDVRIVSALIAAGADVNLVDGEGRTPLDVALSGGREQVARLLREHGGKTGAELQAEQDAMDAPLGVSPDTAAAVAE